MLNGDIKGEAFKHLLKNITYVKLLDKKEKIKKLERKYIRENKTFYDSWTADKWEAFEEEEYGTRLYKETALRIGCYEAFTKAFDQLYKIGIAPRESTYIDKFIEFLRNNGVKIIVYTKIQPVYDVGIVEVDPRDKEKLLEAYSNLKDGNSLISEELAYFKGWNLENITKGLLLSIKDAIDYGYCKNHEGLINSFLAYYRAPSPENRPSLINMFKKYNIRFVYKRLEGMRDSIKRLLENYKIKLLQIIKRCKKIANFSGGKDSAYMILKGIDEGIKFDYIVYADTELEYPDMYSYIDKFERYIKQKIIRLKPKVTFDQWFYKPFAYGKLEGKIHGFPYVVGDGCWAKRELKTKSIEAFKKSIDGPVVDYIGIAADEPERYKKLILDKQQAPLMDWGITENQCKNELENINLLNPLYCKFKRLGCWLCPKQNLNSLKVLYNDYPNLWDKLKKYQQHDYKTFKPNLSVDDIEKKILLLNY